MKYCYFSTWFNFVLVIVKNVGSTCTFLHLFIYVQGSYEIATFLCLKNNVFLIVRWLEPCGPHYVHDYND